MNGKRIFLLAAIATATIFTMATGACKSSPTLTATTTTPVKPGTGMVINSDSIVSAKIQGITKQSTGYPWKVDVLIQSTQDVGNLPNPVKESIDKVVTVVTDQDMNSYKVNDTVMAKIKYVGDVNIPAGISLYMYNVAMK